MRSPLTTLKSPRLGFRSLRITRNQWVCLPMAQSSFAPFQSGNANKVACAEPTTKSSWPSRKASKVLGTGNSRSTDASKPSDLKQPNSTAAMMEIRIRNQIGNRDA